MRKPLNLDSDLEEFLAAEDRLELKRQRAIERQTDWDRPTKLSQMHMSGKQLLFGFMTLVGLTLGGWAFVYWAFWMGTRR
jgi:hypothetical protein